MMRRRGLAEGRRGGAVRRRRMLLESLEERQLLATFTFQMPKNNGPDDVTLGFNSATNSYEIRSTATQERLASRRAAASLSDIKVVGNEESDTLRIAGSFLMAALPMQFAGGIGAPDTIGATADANMTLKTGLLTITPLVGSSAAVTLVGVENAVLTGASGDNVFFANAFAPVSGGNVTLNGGAGDDQYTILGGSSAVQVTVNDSSGDDTYTEAGEGTVTINDTGGGEDEYFPSGSTFTSTDDGGDDVYDITGESPDSDISIDDLGGNDSYTEAGEGTVTIDDTGGGEDEYFPSGSTFTSTDDGGDDVYGITGESPDSDISIDDLGGNDSYTEAGEGTVTIDDTGGGEDEYFPSGSTFTSTDDGGDDVYGITGESPDSDISITDVGGNDSYTEAGEGSVTVHDTGGGEDEYFPSGSTFTSTDDGGDDVYGITGESEDSDITVNDAGGDDVYTESGEGTVEINDASGGDTFDIHGSTVIVNDQLGDDFYTLHGIAGSTIQINDPSGSNFLNLSSFTGSPSGSLFSGLAIDISDAGVTIRLADGTLVATLAGRLAQAIASQFDDRIALRTTSGSTLVRALGGNDVINGSTSTSDDILDGGLGDDVMRGGIGNTTFVEMPGSADVIIDSGGVDTIDFSAASLGVKFNLSLGTGQPQNVDAVGNTVAVSGTLEIVIGSNYDDDLVGSSGSDVLVGLAGNDRLVGHSGRDVLIGGTGSDRIIGGTDEDILIAGETTYDRNDAALRAILAEWSQAVSNAVAVASLRNPSDGTPVVLVKGGQDTPGVTVLDDDDNDQITGSNGPDWILFAKFDVVTDLDEDVDIINNEPVPGA